MRNHWEMGSPHVNGDEAPDPPGSLATTRGHQRPRAGMLPLRHLHQLCSLRRTNVERPCQGREDPRADVVFIWSLIKYEL